MTSNIPRHLIIITMSGYIPKYPKIYHYYPNISGWFSIIVLITTQIYIYIYIYTEHIQKISLSIIHRIGLWEKLEETPIFNGKNMVSCRFSLKPTQWIIYYCGLKERLGSKSCRRAPRRGESRAPSTRWILRFFFGVFAAWGEQRFWV